MLDRCMINLLEILYENYERLMGVISDCSMLMKVI